MTDSSTPAPDRPADPAGRAADPAERTAPTAAVPPAVDLNAQMLRVDARRVVLLGTAIFAAVALGLLPFWSWLGQHDHRVWFWTAACGAALGLLALPLIGKHTGEGRLG